MQEPKIHWYFVEGDTKVSVTDSFLNHEPYREKITIDQIRKILKPFSLRETKEFEDVFLFSSGRLELIIDLKPEANFFDDENPTTDRLEVYVTLVDFIMIDFLKPLTQVDLNILVAIMEGCHLNIYNRKTETYFRNKNELAVLATE